MFKKNKWNKCEQDSSWQFSQRKYLTFKIFVLKKKIINSLLLCLEKKNPKNMTWYVNIYNNRIIYIWTKYFSVIFFSMK